MGIKCIWHTLLNEKLKLEEQIAEIVASALDVTESSFPLSYVDQSFLSVPADVEVMILGRGDLGYSRLRDYKGIISRNIKKILEDDQISVTVVFL